jgi:hypothetical protein
LKDGRGSALQQKMGRGQNIFGRAKMFSANKKQQMLFGLLCFVNLGRIF